MSRFNLVADIGGTNARFALLHQQSGAIQQLRVYPTGRNRFEETLAHYWAELPNDLDIDRACFACATAIVRDPVDLTNAHWSIPLAATRERYGFSQVKAVNDFSALSLAVPDLHADDLRQVGGGEAQREKNRVIIGPGTGLGVGALIHAKGHWLPVEGEGGHTTIGATSERELALFTLLARDYGAMDAELMVSGMGLPIVYRALCQLDGVEPEPLAGPDIFRRAEAAECPRCEELLELFCLWLGDIAGNAALTFGAWGGVYIGGGIVPKLGERFLRSGFRQRFEAKGRYQSTMQRLPIWIIHKDNIALQGAGRALAPIYDRVGLTV